MNDLIEEQKNKDNLLKQELVMQIVAAEKMAEWIFFDVYYNCDGQAAQRTAARLKQINDQHGKEALFGITGYWAMRGYWKMRDAFQAKGVNVRPDMLPQDVQAILEKPGAPEEMKRAYVSAQQFVGTMTHENALMAKAIFDVAYDAGVEDVVSLMQNVLLFSLRFTMQSEALLSS